jgi:hypothetical protein
MKVFIPIRTNEVLSESVRRSIEVQGGQITLVENTPLSTLPGRTSAWRARDEIVDLVKGLSNKYIVTNDANAWHLFTDNLECMRKCLEARPDVGAVGLWRNGSNGGFAEEGHVYLSCVMWRREVLAAMPKLVGNHDPKTCCCDYYGEAIRAMGTKRIFLDSTKRIQETY